MPKHSSTTRYLKKREPTSMVCTGRPVTSTKTSLCSCKVLSNLSNVKTGLPSLWHTSVASTRRRFKRSKKGVGITLYCEPSPSSRSAKLSVTFLSRLTSKREKSVLTANSKQSSLAAAPRTNPTNTRLTPLRFRSRASARRLTGSYWSHYLGLRSKFRRPCWPSRKSSR